MTVSQGYIEASPKLIEIYLIYTRSSHLILSNGVKFS
jgi:hypothetical protein